ncbi:hypothetical protein INT47_012673 [Mucor saturninus]|uniref:Heat shock protein 70 n=1 Tax=Mucor saturninus TaxID=64648 RepID=A0A8H7QPK9_9FUNG|nr:hypothetical protein INT47_012673 [Mucor saturninus]
MTSLDRINYVVGIELGATTSGVSIAHVKDPFNVFTVLTWDSKEALKEALKEASKVDLKVNSKVNSKAKSKAGAKKDKKNSQKFLSSILYPSDESKEPICGAEPEPSFGAGVYVANIGQYLVDIDASNEELGQLMDGLTIEKVITDYLKIFVDLAIANLQKCAKLNENKYFQDFINDDLIHEEIETVHYCLVCPTDRQEFLKDCFIKAGIIEKTKSEHRLSFVTEAVAIAHHQLSLGRNKSEIQNDQDYLLCDVGDISIGLAKIHASSTESLSTITEVLDDITQGSINLEAKFRDYLIENMAELNLNDPLIDQFVKTFSDNIKFAFNMDAKTASAISQKNSNGDDIDLTYEDLNKIVFEPFIEGITNFISNADETHGQCKLFLSGKYAADAYFIERLTAKNKGKLEHHHIIVEESFKAVSFGAVSSRIHTGKSQIPFIGEQQSDAKTVLEELPNNIKGNENYDFIIGIDFGTTFSGCSYVQLKDKNGNHLDIDGKPSDKQKIKTIKLNWPGGKVRQYGKTPTLLMYDEKMNPKYWGDEAKTKANPRKGLILLGNFKLFLCPDSLEKFYGQNDDLKKMKEQCGFNDDETPTKNVKDNILASKVIADYLRVFKNHVIEQIITSEMNESFHVFNKAKLLKKYKMRYVITVPAMWNTSARDTMAQAAVDATLIKEDEIDQLLMISEPEAAALYCENRFTEYIVDPKRDVNDPNIVDSKGDINNTNFIVCDAGGGTVDLVTFNLKVNEKKESMICQIGDGIGDTCGSTYLDVKFKDYIMDFYDSFGVNIDRSKIQLDSVMDHFIRRQKTQFMPDLQGDSFYDISLPGKGVLNFSSSPKYIMADNNRTLRMKNQEMKQIVFDPIVKRIFDLIDNQRNQAEKGGRKIDAILMVGGFSQSEYLQRCIKDRYKGVCRVSVPFEGVTAISHGAVSYALNPRMISRRSAGQSLGLEVQAPFIRSLTDSNERRVEGPDGDKNFEKDRVEYFVRRDQELEGERRTVYKKDVYVVYPNAAVIAIFSCDSKNDANSRYITTRHAKIMEAKVIMPSIDGIDGRKIHFTVSLQVEHIGISVSIECQDSVINAEIRRITKDPDAILKITPKCNLNVASCKQPLIEYSLAKTGYLFNIRETAR